MLNYSFFIEIIQSLKHHKLRNILTGFGVAWGIFILIILLGAGQGLQDGIMKLFSSYAQNSIWVYAGKISDTRKYRKADEKIIFNKELINSLSKHFNQIEKIASVIFYNGKSDITFENKSQSGNISGVGLDYFSIKLLKVAKGKIFNQIDFKRQSPVCIIGSNISEILFKDSDALGKFIKISDNWFKVVGVLEEGGASGYGERNAVYIPLPVFQNSFAGNNEFTQFGMLLHKNVNSKLFEEKLRQFIAYRLNFNVEDKRALLIINQDEQIQQFNMVFTAVKMFLWFVGISMLLTGIIGVGNIMLVVVKERTKEIGIRKAIGAKSKSILLMIVSESIVITLSAGTIGMVLGIIVIKIANIIISKSENYQDALINSFGINLSIISGALLLLILSGALAGIFPAKRAAGVMPVIALNDE